jgi:hypothetical protein
MTDTACNYVGGRQVAETMVWNGADAFRSMPMTPISLYPGTSPQDGPTTIGAMKSSGGLTFLQVEAAGHMVPLDQVYTAIVPWFPTHFFYPIYQHVVFYFFFISLSLLWRILQSTLCCPSCVRPQAPYLQVTIRSLQSLGL